MEGKNLNEIENWYDYEYDEWKRLENHRIEFDMTKRYLHEYVSGNNLEILDIGGGPGRYSMYLAEKGHKVTLLDLSKRNLQVAKENCLVKGITLEGFIHGNALDLSNFEQKYDCILLMGPLYHLIKESERKLAVQGALNLLKPNGILIASFISNYAPIQDCLSGLYPITSVNELLGYFKIGENKDHNGFTTAYFTGYQEAREFMENFGLNELVFAGLENILGCKEKEIKQLTEEEYNKWLEIGYQLSKDKNVIGTSQHYLYIGRKS